MEELKTLSPEQLGELLLNDPSWTVMRAMFNDVELQILNETILEEDIVGDAKEIVAALGRPCSHLPTVSIAAYINTFKGESDTERSQNTRKTAQHFESTIHRDPVRNVGYPSNGT